MDHVDTTGNGIDLDIDLESGVTTSGDDDTIKSQIASCKTSKYLMGRIRNGFMNSKSERGSKSYGDCSSGSYGKLTISAKISDENKEQFGKHMEDKKMGFVNKASNEEKLKKHNYGHPCKPPRPPKGPSLNTYDMKLMKEINVLNLKRKRMEKRALREIRKDKPSSWAGNIFACLVTLVFLLVIILQGNEYPVV